MIDNKYNNGAKLYKMIVNIAKTIIFIQYIFFNIFFLILKFNKLEQIEQILQLSSKDSI